MTLKGYQWLVNDKVVMSIHFKDLVLNVWEDVSDEELQKFINWLKEHHTEPIRIWYKKSQEKKIS